MSIYKFLSSGDINEYRFVSLSTSANETVTQTATSYDDSVIGVSDNAVYTTGLPINVLVEEKFTITYGTTITAGDRLTSDSTGRAIPATLPGQRYYARAIFGGTVGAKLEVLREIGSLEGEAYSMTSSSGITQYYLVGYDGNACGSGKACIGVAKNTATAGGTVYINTVGVTYAITGGSYSAGDILISDSSGRVVAASAFAVAAPTVSSYDKSKASIDSGATPVTSTSANGASLITFSSGFVTLSGAPTYTGSDLSIHNVAIAIQQSTGAAQTKLIKLL